MADDVEQNGTTRRQFLKYVVVGGAVVVSVAIAVPAVGYFLSPTWQKKTGRSIPIARTSEIPIGEPTFIRFEQRVADGWQVTTESLGLWVVNHDGKNFTVFDPHCTHLRCPYYWSTNEKRFICPCHNGFFDIEGKVIGGTSAPPSR